MGVLTRSRGRTDICLSVNKAAEGMCGFHAGFSGDILELWGRREMESSQADKEKAEQ